MTGSIHELALNRFGEPNRHLSSRRELRFGRKGSVSVQLEGERAGAWYDHEAQEGGWLKDGERRDYTRPAPRQRGAIETEEDRVRALRSILDRTTSARGTPAEAYLRSRGIDEWPEMSVRFCRSPHGALWLARDGAGGVRAVQVVYLTKDGEKDRRSPVAKRTIAEGRGWNAVAAVRLPGRGETILCEGVETGLSAWLATGRPVLCGMGIGIFLSFRLQARRITFGCDGNAPYDPQTYALSEENRKRQTADKFMQGAILARRSNGIRVKVVTPPVGEDFNSIHQAHGLQAVADIIKAAT